jgi:molybdopterin-guanine dinucleotide biosynthesis protein A
MTVRLTDITGVILAGGKSSRFGSNKALARVHGIPLIQHVRDQLSGILKRIVVVTNSPEEYSFLDIPVVTDIIPHRGPLGGIHTALETAGSPWVFVTPCDLPFFSYKLLTTLARNTDGSAAVYYIHGKNIEPLPLLLNKKMLGWVFRLLELGDYAVQSLLDSGYTQKLPVEHVMHDVDPGMLVNCNTIEDYEKAVRNG